MTRGKIVAVLPDGRLVTSTEFNGDMYYSDGGYGTLKPKKNTESLLKILTGGTFVIRIVTCSMTAYMRVAIFTICLKNIFSSGFPTTSM